MPGVKGKSGRSPELTPAVMKSILDDVAGGLPESRAALAVGFVPSTISNWKTRAERDIKAGKDSIYVKFMKGLIAADIQFEKVRLALIRKAGIKEVHWSANLQLLRSKYEHWRIPTTIQSEKDKEGNTVPFIIQITPSQKKIL